MNGKAVRNEVLVNSLVLVVWTSGQRHQISPQAAREGIKNQDAIRG